MILHISDYNIRIINVESFQWQTFNFFDNIVRWAVPIFVMISGALFLDRDISIEKICKKYILRIATAFGFWSVLYAAVLSLTQGTPGIVGTFIEVILGPYHMWFLYMIVGLYLIVPFCKKIVESEVLIKYFLALGLVFTFIVPQGMDVLPYINGTIGDMAGLVVEKIHFHFTLEYIYYFILGYYLSKVDISKKTRSFVYCLSAVGFLVTIFGTSFASAYSNGFNQDFHKNFTLNVMLEALGIFVLFKYSVASINISEKMQDIVAMLSKYSFGAYLVHAMVIAQLDYIFGLNTLSFNPILSIIVITLIVFVVSYAISCVCNRIPLLNKYIV